MTAPAHAPAIAFLHRAGLFTAILALIAGIFGMHVMTATHAMHSPATAAPAVSAHHVSSPSDLGVHPPGPSAAPEMPAEQDEASARTVRCTDLDHCTSMQSISAGCTPSAKTGSLAAPLPGTGIIARNTNAVTLTAGSAQWTYLPGSPSPGELCISRT